MATDTVAWRWRVRKHLLDDWDTALRRVTTCWPRCSTRPIAPSDYASNAAVPMPRPSPVRWVRAFDPLPSRIPLPLKPDVEALQERRAS